MCLNFKFPTRFLTI